MTTLAERADELQQRLAVRRFELSRKGAFLVELSGDGEPRWVEVGGDGERELDPTQDEALPFAGRLADLRVEQEAVVVAWRPGRRMVVRLRREGVPGGVAFVKALRAGRLRQALERHVEGARAAREAGLAAAPVLSVEPPTASFTLGDLGRAPVPVEASQAGRFERLGAALARFQVLEGGPELARHDVAAELEVLDSLASKAARLRGALPEGWETTRRVAGAALAALGRRSLVRAHRDLHDRQLLARDEGVALLDFDLLCAADEALDPANLLAHLELRELQGLAGRADAAACAEAFRAGYGRVGDTELERRLAAWRAAALLRLALVYHLRPPYAELGPSLVERAQSWLREVRRGAL